jgi:hypothetical protein
MMGAKETGARLLEAALLPDPLNTPLNVPPAHPEMAAASTINNANVAHQVLMRPAAAVRMLNTRSDSALL